MNFSDLQNLLKEKFGIDHLADIARELGVSPQAVSNWKARNRVPYKYIVKIRNDLKNQDKKENYSESTIIIDNDHGLKKNKDNFSEYDQNIYFSDILLVLARQLKIIIIIPFITSLLAIIYALFFTTPVYESTAKIMSSSSGPAPSQAVGIAAQFGINIPGSQPDPEWDYSEIIKSRTIARAMLKRKFDTEEYGTQKSLLQILTYGYQSPEVGLDTLIKDGVDKVINMINIQNNGSFYDLTISATEPIFARDFAIALIDELDSHQRDYNKKKTSETRKFIEDRIEDTRFELENAEETLKIFNDRNRRIENSPTLQLERQRLLREVSVLIGVFTTLKQQLETTKIEEVKESDYVVVLDPPEAPLIRSKPNRKKMVIFAGIFGIGFGIVMGFLREYIENSDQFVQEKMSKVKSLLIKNFVDLLPQFFKNK